QIEAMTMATHIGVLEEGRLVQYGTPKEIYEDPASVYVAGRLGSPRINILPAELFPGAHKGAQIGLRPENIRQGDGVEATVLRSEHLGDQTRLHLDLQGHAITTLTDPQQDYAANATLKISPQDPLYFDASGARVV
ncbi:MAG: TOBE domain-containing protein, partial [Litoreibacter sp.]|nr:TOBE domain-containing protein [Litoreibacter sp.]